jgi:hypothetical protein
LKDLIGAWSMVLFRNLNSSEHKKHFPCYKRYKNSRKYLDEKAKCQPWIIKVMIKKPNLDSNGIKT